MSIQGKKSLFCDVLSDIFLFRENCIKKCHSFPSHLSLYFIKYAPSILFLKILKYYNSTILYKSPKNPIFVQLSPIQCTYSNIFIRFFKFFPANTNIYQNSYRVIGALCTFEITLLQAIMLTLMLVCAFFSTQVQKYLAWVL